VFLEAVTYGRKKVSVAVKWDRVESEAWHWHDCMAISKLNTIKISRITYLSEIIGEIVCSSE
jgi:hypothetical protein